MKIYANVSRAIRLFRFTEERDNYRSRSIIVQLTTRPVIKIIYYLERNAYA